MLSVIYVRGWSADDLLCFPDRNQPSEQAQSRSQPAGKARHCKKVSLCWDVRIDAERTLLSFWSCPSWSSGGYGVFPMTDTHRLRQCEYCTCCTQAKIPRDQKWKLYVHDWGCSIIFSHLINFFSLGLICVVATRKKNEQFCNLY